CSRRSFCFTRLFCVSFLDTAPTGIYPLSLHDALPISLLAVPRLGIKFRHIVDDGIILGTLNGVLRRPFTIAHPFENCIHVLARQDRKSTRLNSSHVKISYAVFCLKKKNKPSRTSQNDQ